MDDSQHGVDEWETLRRRQMGDYRVFSVREDRRRSPRTGVAHDFHLQHLFFGALVLTVCGAAVGGEIAVLRRLSSLVEGTVVFGAQFLQLTVCNQLTDRDVAFATEGVDLVLREGAVGVLG